MYPVCCLHLRYGEKTGSLSGSGNALFPASHAAANEWTADLMDILLSIQFPFLSGNRAAYDDAMVRCAGNAISSTASYMYLLVFPVCCTDSCQYCKALQYKVMVHYEQDKKNVWIEIEHPLQDTCRSKALSAFWWNTIMKFNITFLNI